MAVFESEKRPVSPEALKAVAAARRDVAFRAGVSQEEIVVAQVKAEVWTDTSLGCPEPHRTYAQVETPGYEIVLVAVSREYVYHSDSFGNVVYCGKRLQG